MTSFYRNYLFTESLYPQAGYRHQGPDSLSSALSFPRNPRKLKVLAPATASALKTELNNCRLLPLAPTHLGLVL